MEGDRLLMGVQGNVGKPGAETPTGDFTIYNKDKTKRRVSEPDAERLAQARKERRVVDQQQTERDG